MQDYNAESVATFDKNAARYAERYFALSDYDHFFAWIAEATPLGSVRFLDLACGPGTVSAFIRRKRPEAEVWCVDRSPQMLAEATRLVASVQVQQADCRDLSTVPGLFDAAAFFFGLSYFDDTDARLVLSELHRLLRPGAALLLATVAGEPALTGAQCNAAGDRVFSFYRRSQEIEQMMQHAGFVIEQTHQIPSPANASVKTEDVLVRARASPK
ncbi:ubiquinone/menaquinone biosynthesis C-methylase UbiE [Paucibacter oligotrophus]|uniref:Ubiquinone/menaquinone biosynthesis C-methylase UbiE n=1 Tax=Roseateles oligotrophus TaxID=1769250 RepID=A0A840L776_9BURK|nr:class I SAM-dependent methyltransferase [Roseateles oligotrophus]MBB4842009.1 ubiquinone/menaquinone biosynthesis C-methylase UbiE [Roseateles oligotrophus]